MGPLISSARRVIVVPCYNEAERLDEEAFLKLAHAERVELLFVDDGSKDRTAQVLERLAEQADSVRVLSLKANVGKGEAVRLGLRDAIADGASVVGYYDADLATPPDDLLRMLDRLETDDHLMAVFGSRVARLGSHIERGAPALHRTHLRHHGIGRLGDDRVRHPMRRQGLSGVRGTERRSGQALPIGLGLRRRALSSTAVGHRRIGRTAR